MNSINNVSSAMLEVLSLAPQLEEGIGELGTA
jgi:hypothetical protein